MKTILFILVSFLALTSVLSALLMMSIPDGSILNLSISLLKGTIFKDFVLPGFLLFLFVGSVNLLAVFFNISNHPLKYNWALAGGFVALLWVLLQFLLINQSMWVDIFYVSIGVSIILISLQLKVKSLI